MNKLERKQLNERKENQRYTRDNMLWIGMATPAETYPYPQQRHNAKKEKALSYRTKDVDGWK